jgi:membrane protein DedA with SNARE-associated domain
MLDSVSNTEVARRDAMDALLNWIPEYGYPALFLLLMLGIVGLPVPDETLLTFSGYLIFKNELTLMPTMATAFLGSICGITASYVIGRRLGCYFVRTLGRILRIGPDDLDQVKAWYVRWGKYALIFGYFVPGVRHLVALVAGSSNLPLVIFMPFAYTGALIWSATFLGLGYGLGETWVNGSAIVHQVLAVASGVVFLLLIRLFVLRMRKIHDGHA